VTLQFPTEDKDSISFTKPCIVKGVVGVGVVVMVGIAVGELPIVGLGVGV
jgi:hypothetical protein